MSSVNGSSRESSYYVERISLYREKIFYRDIYTNIIDKFDVISWLSTLYMYGVDQGHIFSH